MEQRCTHRYVASSLSQPLQFNVFVSPGVPHTAMEDGIISGYLIPKGSIILANLWYEALFSNPAI
jgi:hypothetical protein